VEIRLENIYVPVQFQGHMAKAKVTAAENGGAQVCASLGQLNCVLLRPHRMYEMRTIATDDPIA